MNITLSADKSLIEKARQYARKNNTSLNNLVREYLRRLVNSSEVEHAANEFEKIALENSGESNADFKFNRDEIYNRGK